MSIRHSVAAAFCAAALVGIPAVAGAQAPSQPAAPTLQDRETARGLMDDGDKKRDAGDQKGALSSYEKADALMHVPTTGIEVARMQLALNLFLEARETLLRVSKSTAKPGEPAPFGAARKQADQLNKDLDTRIPSILIQPTNLEPGQPAVITVDGEEIPPAAAAVPRKVNPGTHSIDVKSGSLEKKLDVTVAEKENKTVDVDLKDQPKTAVLPPPPPPKEASSTGKILMFGGFGVGVVGLGLGTITGIMSMTKTSNLKDRCKNDKCPAGSQSDIDSAKTLGNISTVGFIVGIVGAGVGVVGVVLSGKEAKQDDAPPPASAFHPTDVRAELGPTWAGLTGRF